MNKKVVYTIIIILLIGVTLYFVNQKYQLTNFRKPKMINLSLASEHNGQKIMTGFIIETPYETIRGNTSQSYEMIRIPKNEDVTIYNTNLGEQKFYTDKRKINVTDEYYRLILKLEEPKPIIVEYNNDRPITIRLYSDNAREISFCMRWSVNYIFVKPEGYEKVEKIKGYEKWDSCYNGNFSLIEDYKEINISYSVFGIPRKGDYINVSFVQKQFLGLNDKNVKIK